MAVDIIDFDVTPGPFDGSWVLTPKQVTDERGTIRELFRRSAFEAAGVALAPFQQVNVTGSARGVVRGMHAEDMTKLLTLASGEALGVYVDLRLDAATFGAVATIDLRPGVQVLVPAGVANGFQALTDDCQYVYCFDAEWTQDMAGESCSPLSLGIDWPIPVDPSDPAQISAKDAAAPPLSELRSRHLERADS